MKHNATIQNASGQQLAVSLSIEGTREVATLMIDGVPYHIERMKAATLQREYRVDGDKDYTPQRDRQGRCVIVAPFSQR